jgi:hypothetical protein
MYVELGILRLFKGRKKYKRDAALPFWNRLIQVHCPVLRVRQVLYCHIARWKAAAPKHIFTQRLELLD